MDSGSWVLSEKSEVLASETWNYQRHVFFVETQLLKRDNGGELFSCVQGSTISWSFQERERAVVSTGSEKRNVAGH